MQAKKRYLLLWLFVLILLVMCLLKSARKPENFIHPPTFDVDNVEDLPSFMDGWQQSSEVGRPPAAKTYEARQQMPFHTSYRKTNKNCRYVIICQR